MSWLINHSRWMLRLVIGGLLVIIITGFAAIAVSHFWIVQQTSNRLYDDVADIPTKPVGLVLGTSKYVANGRINLYFQYRINAAARLFKAGKVQHLLVSGDNHTKAYNETVDMQQALIAEGVPKTAITLDYAGFRTLDSVVRAKKIFSLDELMIISQAFHNKRALFISDFYGLNAVGFNAQDVVQTDIKTRLREFLARFKAVLDLYVLDTQPRYLGKQEPIILLSEKTDDPS